MTAWSRAEQSRAEQSRAEQSFADAEHFKPTLKKLLSLLDDNEYGPFTDDVLFAALMIGEEFEDEFRKKEEPDGAEKSSTA